MLIKKKILGFCYQDAYEKFKKNRIFGMYTFHKPSLVVVDLDIVRTILTKEFGHFHDRGLYCHEKVDPLTGHIFSLPGQKWRNLRVKMTPTFTSGKMKQMFDAVKHRGEILNKVLKTKSQENAVIEIKDIFARFVFLISILFFFSFPLKVLTIKLNI